MSGLDELIGDMLDSIRAEDADVVSAWNVAECECGCMAMRGGRTPSKYQSAILHAFKNGTENILIQAVAGSGKTSTLVMLSEMMSGESVFLAFNRAIAEELGKKLPRTVTACTFHSLGWNAVKPRLISELGYTPRHKDWVQARKCESIFDEEYGRTGLKSVKGAVKRLVGLMKNSLMKPDVAEDELSALIGHFDIEWEDAAISEEQVIACARRVLEVSNGRFSVVDFDDMLYLPWLLGVRMRGYQYVMVDEAQDTNAVQRWILAQLLSRRGRLIAVGDEYQAIYGFRGADADSMSLIREEFACVEMPLSISYRCARSIVEEAQMYVEGIEAREGAEDGVVRGVGAWKMRDFRADDLVVCRNRAPLVRTAYALIVGRVGCRILGSDIGRGLVTMIEKVGGRTADLSMLIQRLGAHRDSEVKRAMESGQEGRAGAIADKVDTVLMLVDSLTDSDRRGGVQRLVAIIEGMFRDNGDGAGMLTLCTVHKAKGLESKRVFVLDAGLMPSKYARQPWQQVQERNLQYVAVTRAMSELVYVDSDSIE